MDIFGYPWIYPLSEQKAMDIHGYIHTGLCSETCQRINVQNFSLIASVVWPENRKQNLFFVLHK